MRRLVEEEGRTIFLSSHDLADVEELGDDVVVINRGKMVTMGRIKSLLDTASDGFEVAVENAQEAATVFDKGWFGGGNDRSGTGDGETRPW